jgi:diguanylate cyclase (GGDEF)-like protein/PAS domain S-box-containing protein
MRRTVLLIEDNSTNAAFVRQALLGLGDYHFVVERVNRCDHGCERLALREGSIAAVLTNLSLPDSQGLQTISKLVEAAPHVPILVLTDAEHEHIAMQAIERGAQDYVLQDHLDKHSLPKIVHNMLHRAANTAALFATRDGAQITLNPLGDAVVSTDAAGNITYVSRVIETMTGWTLEEAVGRPFDQVFRIIHSTNDARSRPIVLAIRENRVVYLAPGSTLIRRDDPESAIEDLAAPLRDRTGKISGTVMVFRDLTQARAPPPRMPQATRHDYPNELPNRPLLTDRLSQAIASAHRHQEQLAVLFVDVDRFKHVNDSLGHAVGDRLLLSIAARLVAGVRASDTVSHQRGDEFVVLLSTVAHAQDAALIAQKLLDSLSLPHHVDQNDLNVTACIGISIYPDDGTDGDTLIRNADIAMLSAKRQAGSNYGFFKPHMNEREIERRFLECGLRHALARHEFVLHYQPKIDLQTEMVVGAEALIRWGHAKRGTTHPLEYMSFAKQSGYIIPIGRWVLREGCRQIRRWLDADLAATPVAINISAIELRAKDFVESVRDVLRETALEPHFLELEMTESALLQDLKSTTTVLYALKDLGVRLALDNFGMGTSSLTHLKGLPIDALKIDTSLVCHLCDNAHEAGIVGAIIGAGKSFNLRVIAQGVETREQFVALQSQHCTEAQGFYFYEPLPADAFNKLLKSDNYTTVVT